ncbi:MAG: hypothetical protein IJP80_03930 [Bacteroidales bacterium]|nr:hypothetical protein [Bacteroidales bacterium]
MATILKLDKGTVVGFMNKDLLYVDFKQISLDRVLTNLFIKMRADGRPITLKYRKETDMERMYNHIQMLEEKGKIEGATDNKDAIEDWLRSSLLEMVNRGNSSKEHISTLKPLHLLSYRVQNSRFCRDYRASDQLYLMLKSNPEVMGGLVRYLSKGWDKSSNDIIPSENLDVDTTGILYITTPLQEQPGVNKTIDETPKPFLKEQSALFCDDIRRLLLYQNRLPRSVFIDYLRILCGLHLSLYTIKLICLLPKMVKEGTRAITDDWTMLVDVTDNLDSDVSEYACRDFATTMNNMQRYIRATYMVDMVQAKKHCSVDEALSFLCHENDRSDAYYQAKYDTLRDSFPEKRDDEFDQADFDEMLSLYDDDDYFGRLIHLLEKSNLGSSQYRYLREFVDSAGMKNTPSMLIADSRSHRHPRRGVLGSKLLETMVQMLVLKENEDGSLSSRPLSIDELAKGIRDRYGLVVNGSDETRFADGDVAMHAAFQHNMEAFKYKLRQIGFYSDTSDACIMQKIRPRYKL